MGKEARHSIPHQEDLLVEFSQVAPRGRVHAEIRGGKDEVTRTVHLFCRLLDGGTVVDEHFLSLADVPAAIEVLEQAQAWAHRPRGANDVREVGDG